MILATVALSLVLAQPTTRTTPTPPTPAPASPTLEQFFKIRAPSSVRLAPDGSLYAADWPDGITQLYRRAPGAPIDAPMQKLTDFPDGMSGYRISPDGSRVIVSAGVGGNEQTQLYLVGPSGPTPLTANPAAVHSFEAWTRDGKGFIYTANDAVSSDFHIYRYDFAGGGSTKLLAEQGSWGASDITDDGGRVLVGRYFSASHSIAYELVASTGELREIKVGEGESSTYPVAYLPGEDRVLISTDAFTGQHNLAVVMLADGRIERLFPDIEAFDVEDVTIDDDRTRMAVVYNEEGYATMRLYELPGFSPIQLPAIDRGIIGGVDLGRDHISWTLSNARTPGLAFASKIEGKRCGPARPLTQAHTQGIDLGEFTLPRLVSISSFDGLEFSAFLYLPPGHVEGNPIPFVVNFHGGPEGQFRPGFSRNNQYLLSRGFGILEPNVRGSTGRGREFHRLDNYKKRWDSVRDGVEAARWLVARGYSEPGRIAAAGGSYGGFMAVACVIEGSDVFGAGIDVVGIVNFRTFLEQTRDYRRALREAEYGPLSDPEFLDSVSPIHRADEIRCPMMIVHGLNDPRVPVGEAMQLAVALQKRGLDPELLFFPDEGHGIAKLENRLLYGERMAVFLEASLKGR